MAPTDGPEDQDPSAVPEDADQPGEEQEQPPQFSWMQDTLQWGIRAKPGKHGLTMRDLNLGVYGEVPEESRDMTRRPRGAFPIPGLPRLDSYSINSKEELWADNAVDLYEEAIQRRWAAPIDIPWDTIEPLPQDLELAMCQLCTELCQHASVEADTIGQWLHRMNYAYHEVKTFLASEEYDSGRHYEVFRHRALCNGGVMGLESIGKMNRRLVEGRSGWPETSMSLYLIRGLFTLFLYRYGEAYAHNPAEKLIFRLCMQDKARHLAYGMAHLKYTIQHKGPDYATGLLRLTNTVERDLAGELADPVLGEALAIIFGGSVANVMEGMDVVRKLQRQYLEAYIRRSQWVGIPKTEENLRPELLSFLRDEGESS